MVNDDLDRDPDPMNDELNRALDKGSLAELPDNVPPGLLGEVAPDLNKTEDFRPTLSAGIIQESTPATRMLTIALFYVLIFTAPVAAWLLWRDPRRSVRAKVLFTVVGVLGYVAFFWSRRFVSV